MNVYCKWMLNYSALSYVSIPWPFIQPRQPLLETHIDRPVSERISSEGFQVILWILLSVLQASALFKDKLPRLDLSVCSKSFFFPVLEEKRREARSVGLSKCVVFFWVFICLIKQMLQTPAAPLKSTHILFKGNQLLIALSYWCWRNVWSRCARKA